MRAPDRPDLASRLRRSHARFAPLSDLVAGRALRRSRAGSIAALRPSPRARLLLPGAGTGHDLVLLDPDVRAVCVDFTPETLLPARARSRQLGRSDSFVIADAQRLPFLDGRLPAALLHLVPAVVPDARRALAAAPDLVLVDDEAAVPGGSYRRIIVRKEDPE